MTYGVDQCRVCGVAIKVHGPEDMADWLEAQKRSKMPEKVWRSRGYLAAPTKRQMQDPAHGCCADCGYREMRRKTQPFKRLAIAGAVVVLAFALVWTVLTYAPFNGAAR
jgi:hypothetical protein